jgi:RecG-like helicase
MKRYSGMSFHVQKLKDRFDGWVSKNGTPPVGSKAWEAKLEIQKLPNIIADRTKRLSSGDLTPQQRAKLEQEVTHLEHQLDGYKKDFKTMDKDPGKGFVAAEGFPKKALPDAETVRRDQIAHGGWYTRKHERRLIHEAKHSAHDDKHLKAKTDD